MFNRIALFAATMLVASAGHAGAATYNIAISGACDTLTLTVTSGVIVGQPNAPNCDTGNEVGYQATVKKLAQNQGRNQLIVGSDFGAPPDAWTWTFNLATSTATLSGTPDGVTLFGPTNFTFTYTKGGAHQSNGLPSATSILLANQH